MKTIQFKPKDVLACAQFLNEGKLVAIPTDTVYGIAVIADNATQIVHLREVKQRPDEKALAYMVGSLEMIEAVCELTARDRYLIKRFLPGPITFVFNKKKPLPIIDESGVDTLAIRIPNHPFVLALMPHLRKGLYVPSANRSNMPPAVNSNQVLAEFDGVIEAVVLGQAEQAQASTIIDCSKPELKCLREGPISFEEVNHAQAHF